MRRMLPSANWTLLGALILALLIWVNVAFRSKYKYSFPVPVHIGGLPEKLVPVEPLAIRAEVRAEATGRDLFVLLFSKPEFRIDGRSYRRGTNKVPLQVDDLDIPESVTLLGAEVVAPLQVEVTLDRLQERTVPVGCNVELKPKDGWVAVGTPTLEPARVTVSGPASLVRKLRRVQTDSIVVDDAAGALRFDVPLRSASPTVRCTPPQVVYAASVQRLSERRIKDIPVRVLRVPSSVEAVLDEPSITLTVIGGEEVVSGLTRDDIEVTLDYRKLEQHPEKKFAASIKVPEHVRWVKAEPQRFGLKEKIILRKR